MTPEQIKQAATDLMDLERIEQILKDLSSGSAYVLQIGTNTVNLDRDRSPAVTKALEAYLKGASAILKQKLAPEVEGIEDPFDAALDKLQRDALPHLRKAAAEAGHPEWVKTKEELLQEKLEQEARPQ